jgi:hypothetical protein
LVHILSNSTKTERRKKSCNDTQNFFSNWGTIKHGVPHGTILGPLLFIIYINDLPPTINILSEPIIFPDDTSVTVSSKKFDAFHTRSNTVLTQMSKWFSAKKLAFNLDKYGVSQANVYTHYSPISSKNKADRC